MSCIRSWLCVGAILVFGVTTSFADRPRSWSSADGKFTVKATLVDVSEESVRLKRSDNGKTITVPVKMLSEGDQDFVVNLRYAAALNPPPADAKTEPDSSASDASAPDASNQSVGMPKRDEIGIEALSELEYRLIPFGKIEVPADGMVWRIASPDPPVFVAQKPNDPQALILTVTPASKGQPQRVAACKAIYNQMVTQLKKTGMKDLQSAKLDLESKIPDQVRFSVMGKAAEGGEGHFVTEIHFHDTYTFVFQATSTNAENATFIIENTKTFVPDGSKQSVSLPDDVKEGVTASVTSLQKQLAAGDIEGLLKDVMPPDVYKTFQEDPSKWNDVVRTFKTRKSDVLSKSLQEIDWSKAEYDAATRKVTFPVSPRPVAFMEIDGQWRIQN